MIEPIIDQQSILRLKQLIGAAKHIVITCHTSPDGDAMGSTLGLCRVLRNMSKDAHVVVPNSITTTLDFLPGREDVVVHTENELRSRFLLREAELVFCLDYNALQRIKTLGNIVAENKAPKVLIDHHENPELQCEVMISHPELSSTCELVYRTVSELNLLSYLDTDAARCLYVGMMTDTGNFTYSSEYPAVYEIAGALVGLGIDSLDLYNRVMNTFSADSLRIKGYALSEKMQLYYHKGAALLTLTREETERFNYQKGCDEGLVNMPLSIPGIRWSTYMREEKDFVKVSMRSSGDFTVNDLCERYFKGGGHKPAAGGDFMGNLDGALDVYFEMLNNVDDYIESIGLNEKNRII